MRKTSQDEYHGEPGARFVTDVNQPIVLIIEDNDEVREAYMDYLTWAGFQVRGCAGAPDGFRIAAMEAPALILIDAGLPGMNGWEAVAHFKASPLKSIPVLMVTGHVGVEHEQRAAAAGADAFITKPCSPEELVQGMKRLLANRMSV